MAAVVGSAATRGFDCDCEIVLAPPTTTGESAPPLSSPTRLLAHRSVLAQAPYFAMLFARADPERINLGKIECGEHRTRAVYVIRVPFSPEIVAFLIGRLYAPHRREACRDPVETVVAALFFGMPSACAQDIIVDTLRHLAEDLATAAVARAATTAADSTADKPVGVSPAGSAAHRAMAHFVAHMIAADIATETKTALAARFAYLLPSAPVMCINGRLDAARHYRARAPTPGPDATTTSGADGCRWPTLCISTDMIGAGADRVEWDGLVFGARLVLGSAGDGTDDIAVALFCAPASERLGPWMHADPQPAGMVDVPVHAVRVSARLYHPTRGVFGTGVLTSWSSAVCDVDLHRRRSQSYMAATGDRGPPKGALLVPNGMERMTRGTAEPARRVARTATLLAGADPRDRCLWACEVDVAIVGEPAAGPVL
ncbi:hypothetical protein pdul_cds_399 [Pandoravirus dulcis]|uniref:BTB domain-containing protein n=1 Tax=Pandoravirus dulcis TaxID=1349409 RepID=S4VQ36_9VIRU|nr:hypothetical protein pdul_cds_399 [Pandoravirus dulcis]AGO82443.1 hypothetical protein pdul_cds_399 [Pandoravirus dulcis]